VKLLTRERVQIKEKVSRDCLPSRQPAKSYLDKLFTAAISVLVLGAFYLAFH
jgi:hypothetical protein